MKILSMLGFLTAVLAILFLVNKGLALANNPFTIAIQIFSVLLMIWARITFGIRSFHATANTTKGELVTSGPYHYLRHPIYAAIIYFFIGSAISYPFIEVFIAVALIAIGLFARMILEEKSLMQTYPGYAEYYIKTKRIIPFLF